MLLPGPGQYEAPGVQAGAAFSMAGRLAPIAEQQDTTPGPGGCWFDKHCHTVTHGFTCRKAALSQQHGRVLVRRPVCVAISQPDHPVYFLACTAIVIRLLQVATWRQTFQTPAAAVHLPSPLQAGQLAPAAALKPERQCWGQGHTSLQSCPRALLPACQ